MTEALLTKWLVPVLSILVDLRASTRPVSVGVSVSDKAELSVDVENEMEGDSVSEAWWLRPLGACLSLMIVVVNGCSTQVS